MWNEPTTMVASFTGQDKEHYVKFLSRLSVLMLHDWSDSVLSCFVVGWYYDPLFLQRDKRLVNFPQ